MCDGVPLEPIAAEHGTPLYVYSAATIDEAFAGYPHAIHYALKANSTLAITRLLRGLGSSADANSGGEIDVARRAGFTPAQIVFTGVGKTMAELGAAIDIGVRSINVESAGEIERIEALSRERKTRTKIAIRVNPDVDAKTHPYISTGLRQNKFGVAFEEALPLYREARGLPAIRVDGIDCHIGSQIVELSPFLDALQKVLGLVDRLAAEGIELEHLDLGGGLGIRYQDEQPPTPDRYIAAMLDVLRGRRERILLEPGRALVGNAGLLLTRVEYLKHGTERNFAVVDAGMNDLLRPALYDAWHEIRTVRNRAQAAHHYEIVGPVCESADFLGHERKLALAAGDLLAVLSAGAYGMSMSSNYNSRPRAAEVMVDGDQVHLVRRRESVQDLMDSERLLP